MKKRFNKVSTEHWDAKMGDKFKVIKNHHEVHGDLPKDSIVILIEIAHFPTMYRVKDLETSKLYTVPVHTVKKMI